MSIYANAITENQKAYNHKLPSPFNSKSRTCKPSKLRNSHKEMIVGKILDKPKDELKVDPKPNNFVNFRNMS